MAEAIACPACNMVVKASKANKTKATLPMCGLRPTLRITKALGLMSVTIYVNNYRTIGYLWSAHAGVAGILGDPIPRYPDTFIRACLILANGHRETTIGTPR
jgi:hypothetical protein